MAIGGRSYMAALGSNKSILRSPRLHLKLSKGTHLLYFSEALQYDLLTNTELRLVFPRWRQLGSKPAHHKERVARCGLWLACAQPELLP